MVSQWVVLEHGWIGVGMGMADGMDECWIVLRVGDKELPRVGHKLASCSLLISYVLMFLSISLESEDCYSHGVKTS